MLLTMSTTPSMVTTIDSVGLTELFHNLQYLLHRALSPRPHNVGRSQELEDHYRKLRCFAERLEVSHACLLQRLI
jgi:hypothetical protein